MFDCISPTPCCYVQLHYEATPFFITNEGNVDAIANTLPHDQTYEQ